MVACVAGDEADTLRQQLHQTTAQLEAAAHMGLELAQHNDALQHRLSQIESSHEDLVLRLRVMERDQRWMHEQSLRVDQMRGSLNELSTLVDQERSRRLAGEQRLGQVDGAVARVREDVDALAQAVESGAPRKWTVEATAIQRVLGELRGSVDALDARQSELDERVGRAETRARGQLAESRRHQSAADRRVALIEEAHGEAQAQAAWLAAQHDGLAQQLAQLSTAYAATLDDHEQSIRSLATPLHPAYMYATPQSARFAELEPAPDRPTQPAFVHGESLDDIFAADHSKHVFPSPPQSLASELADARVPRKAQSMVGTPSNASRRMRARVSSFSRLDEKRVVSPSKMSPGFKMISPAHVGLGWGQYWDRQKVGIRERLGLSPVAAREYRPQSDLDKAD
ncbi:hypothetical protein H4S02_000403 [Coemansia sp. RSA 2611]|nr:hypothetical protein H4S02_000403 [Coemansia sp. RSA 2611]